MCETIGIPGMKEERRAIATERVQKRKRVFE
jgi:hypothetical protein